MSVLRSVTRFSHFLYAKNLQIVKCRRAHWNKDWLPGPHPKTEAEFIEAAKKYNLHPYEYKPYDDDGYGYGDYPELPLKGVALRDPFYPYDNPVHKRNFNEPVHVDFDLLGEDRYDAGYSDRYSDRTMICTFLAVFGSLFGLCYVSSYIPMFQPIMEKQYPSQGKKHYTFESSP